jgi:hypothetical protein
VATANANIKRGIVLPLDVAAATLAANGDENCGRLHGGMTARSKASAPHPRLFLFFFFLSPL